MFSSKLKIGLVGLGKMGLLHLEKLLNHPKVEVSGVYDTDSEKLVWAEKNRSVKTYAELDSLFFDSDGIIIASPTPTHYALAQRALNHDLHLLIEKPICQTVPEGVELLKLAEKKSKVLQTGFIERYRWTKLNQEWPNTLDQRPVLISAERSSSSPSRDPSADVVTDLMIHDIDFVLWALKEAPIRVQAEGFSLKGASLDLAYAKLDFPSGCCAHLRAQWIAPQRRRETQIFWPNRRLTFDLINQKANKLDLFDGGASDPVEIFIPVSDSLADQLDAFVLAIEHQTPVLVSGLDGVRAIEICEAIKESISTQSMKGIRIQPREKEFLSKFQGEYVN